MIPFALAEVRDKDEDQQQDIEDKERGLRLRLRLWSFFRLSLIAVEELRKLQFRFVGDGVHGVDMLRSASPFQ